MKFSYFSKVSVLFYVQCILFFPGCKIFDWGKENFKQSDRYETHLIAKAAPYVQSVEVYDQLSTMATFDALFLTDHVRMLYADYYTKRHVLSSEKEAVFRKRLLNENKYYISFYIIGSQPENVYLNSYALHTGRYQKQQTLLADKDACWSVRLKVGDKEYVPDSIRVVDLPVEIENFFGSKYSQFKSTYLVKFDSLDYDEHEILSKGILHNVSLLFTSAHYKTELDWKNVIYSDQQ